jgi:hypothetical protein
MRKAVDRSVGLAFAVPEVVFHRMARMWLAGASPSRRDRDEFYRMWAEKPAAFFQSWNAMMLEMYRANFALSMRVWSAGLGPIHRRAVANAKRLRRAR